MVTTFFHRRYFRVVSHGIESVPDGPVMLVANHGSHVLAWDGAMILTSCLLDADPPRLAHGMAEHRLMELPVLGAAARRIGAVDGRREACQELLRAGGVVLTGGEITIRDRDGRVLNRVKSDVYCSHFGLCHWPMAKDTPKLLVETDRQLHLIDFGGKVAAHADGRVPAAGQVPRPLRSTPALQGPGHAGGDRTPCRDRPEHRPGADPNGARDASACLFLGSAGT